MLQQVAQRLKATLCSDEVMRTATPPALSMAARLGAGLFAVLLTGLRGPREARTAVRVVVDRLCGRYRAGDDDIVLSTSAGVAIAPRDATSAEALLQLAELAVVEAKDSGGAIRSCHQAGQRAVERSRALLRLLPTALTRGDMHLHYQPILDDVLAPRVAAAEVVLRWTPVELGDVAPCEFVPLAEETGLMVAIGSWVVRSACRQVRAWLDAGLPPTRVAVNVSLCQLVRGDLAQVVREALEDARVPPALLQLELSERGVLRVDPEIMRELQSIRALGVRIAVDDFGTGSCGTAGLRQLPVDVVKIDPSLVRGVGGAGGSLEDTSATLAVIGLARELGFRVSAEGVERPEQMGFLRQHGCSEQQGLLYSAALPPDEFAELLRNGLPEMQGVHLEGDVAR